METIIPVNIVILRENDWNDCDERKYDCDPGGEGVLPNMDYVGMYGPKG